MPKEPGLSPHPQWPSVFLGQQWTCSLCVCCWSQLSSPFSASAVQICLLTALLLEHTLVLSSCSEQEQASTLPGFALHFPQGYGQPRTARGRSKGRELREEWGELLLAHPGTDCPQEQPSTTWGPKHVYLMGLKSLLQLIFGAHLCLAVTLKLYPALPKTYFRCPFKIRAPPEAFSVSI